MFFQSGFFALSSSSRRMDSKGGTQFGSRLYTCQGNSKNARRSRAFDFADG